MTSYDVISAGLSLHYRGISLMKDKSLLNGFNHVSGDGGGVMGGGVVMVEVW